MKARLLLIEDEPLYQRPFQRYLEREEYQVSLFADGRDIQRELEHGVNYDLALIDYQIPGVPADKIMQRMRELYPTRPIIAISAYNYKSPHADHLVSKLTMLEPNFFLNLIEDIETLLNS